MWRNVKGAGAVVACAVLLTGTGGAVQAAAGRAPDALSGPHVFGWGFSQPDGISSDGTHVWVTNDFAESVTELDAATGARVHVIIGSSYGLRIPDSLSSDGTHAWVAN